MKKLSLKKRLITGSAGLALLLGILAGVFSFSVAGGTAHAASVKSPDAGVMSVNPLYSYVGKYSGKNSSGYLFSCQEPGAELNCYTPQELLQAYNIQSVQNKGITGKHETIVIIDAFGNPTITDDLNAFDTVFGLPAAKLNIIYPDGQPVFDLSNADEVDWSGEISLDVESSHAVAPAATIDLVVAYSDQDSDIQSALDYVVKHHLGNVLSQSYGEEETCVDPKILAAEHRDYAILEAEGVSVFASSADDGAAQSTCDGTSWVKGVASPASDPLVTSVGATSLTASQPDGNYESETAWNDDFGSTGGGYSVLYNRPFFQNGFDHKAGRGVPDVAYSGDVNNGLLIAWSGGDPTQVGTFYLFGGTSAGSPQWAAITALIDSVYGPQGDLNPTLYRLASNPFVYNSVFHDVTTGNNSVVLADSNNNPVSITGYDASKGWDAVTGLGSLNVGNAIFGLGRFYWIHF
jgi:subtilase family serine protease